MSYSDIKTNQTSQKFILTRIEPARFVNDDLSLDSGTTYTMTFPFVISKVVEQGTELTEVSSSPSTGEYSFNTSTNLLTVNLNNAVSSSNAVVVYYYLFYTIEKFRTIGSDPESPTVDLQDWEPKIISSPNIKQTIKNVINGQLTISSSNLNIINDNGDFNQYLTVNDSFYNKKVQVWHCLDDISNIQKIFEGRITGLTVRRTQVSMNVKDNLDLLSNPASMGDTEIFYNDDDFTKVQPGFIGEPVRYYFGSVSRYDTIPETVTNLTDAQKLDPTKMDEAICTNYTTDITTSNNREWTVGRVGSNGTTNFSFSPSNVDNTDANFTRLGTTAASVAKIHIGDTFEITGSGTYRERVYYVDRTNNYVYITKQAGVIATDTVQTNDCPSLVITDVSGNYYYPLYGRDYTAATSTTSGGNKLIKITFTNNFETNHAGLTTLDPGVNQVYFKIKPNASDQNQATVLKEILDQAGLTTNASSFTTAGTTLNVNAAFSIPLYNESNYNEYYKYVEKICQSTLGYIYLNNSFEIVYKLFATISASTDITDTEIIVNTSNYKIDYQDIVTQFIAYNPHYNSNEFVSTASQTASSNKARYLHNVINTDRFEHVLENYTAKITDQINLRSESDITYTFQTKGINFDSTIGDEYNLTSNDLPGQVNSKGIKIVEIEKGNTQTKLLAKDLYNL
jgi:hypothetical protein